MRLVFTILIMSILPTFSFSNQFEGPSAGVQLTYGDVITSTTAINGVGEIAGFRADYDRDFDGYVLGLGAQIDGSSINLRSKDASIDGMLRLSGRAGLVSGNNLLYGTAGVARARIGGADAMQDSTGYFVGAGYERFVTEEISVGAEALFHRFDDFAGLDGVDADVSTIGLNVNFNF